MNVNDRIEVNVNNVWIPGKVRKIFPDRELGFFSAFLANGTLTQVMLNNEDGWRYPSAAVPS